MSDFDAGGRECVTHHACECIGAQARRARALEEENERVREALRSIADAAGSAQVVAPGDWRVICEGMARHAREVLSAA